MSCVSLSILSLLLFYCVASSCSFSLYNGKTASFRPFRNKTWSQGSQREAIKCTSLPSTVISSFFGIMDVSDFLLSIWISIAFLWFDFHTFNKEITGSQLFCIAYLSSTSPSSQTGGCHCKLALSLVMVLSAVTISTSTISNLIIISQLNHFTFVSALLLPVLRLNLMLPLQFQGLGTGGWLDLTW